MNNMKLYDELDNVNNKLLAYYDIVKGTLNREDATEYQTLLLEICWMKLYLMRKELES